MCKCQVVYSAITILDSLGSEHLLPAVALHMPGNTSSDIWIAGAFAAFTVDLLVYPLDTLKTRIQSPDYQKLFVDSSQNAVKSRALFRGLYQGVGSVIIATLPSSGAFFTTYEGVKSHLEKIALVPTPVAHASASACAELVSCAILAPAEVIKQNAQMVSADSPTNATLQTLRRFKNNPLALWRGYGALAGRNLPFTALQFPLFEKAKEALISWRERQTGKPRRKDTPLWEKGLLTAAAAGSAGSFAAVVTTPVDVVKTRIMLKAATSFADQGQPSEIVDAVKKGNVKDALGSVTGTTTSPDKPAYKKMSSVAIARDIVAKDGWKGLWRGGALRGVWTFLGSGLYLGVYETGRAYLARSRGSLED